MPRELSAEKDGQEHPRRPRRRQQGPKADPGPALLPGQLPQEQAEEEQEEQTDRLGLVGGVVIVPRHIGRSPEGHQIPREDRPAPKADHIPVGHPDQHQQGGGEPGGKDRPPRQQMNGAGDKVVPGQVQPHLEGREVGEQVVVIHPLHQTEGQERAAEEGGPGAPAPRPLSPAEAQGQDRPGGQGPDQGLPRGEPPQDQQREHGGGQRGGGEQPVPPEPHQRHLGYM